jgi:hypothetical protein
MALSAEEKNKVRELKQKGYSDTQIASFIGGQRLGDKPSSIKYLESKEPDEKGGVLKRILSDIPSDLGEGFANIGEQFYSAGEDIVETATDKDLSFGQKVRGTLSRAFSGGARAVGEAGMTALKLPITQEFEDKTKTVVGETIQEGLNDPRIQKDLQSFMTEYESLPDDAKRELKNALGFTEGLTAMAGGNLVKNTAQKTVDKTFDVLSKIKTSIPEIDAPKINISQTAKNVGGSILPKAADLRDNALARSFGLAPVQDIAKINKVLGAEDSFGDFMGRYNLIKNSPQETIESVAKFQSENYNRVRDAISLVDSPYKIDDVQGLRQTVDMIEDELRNTSSQRFASVLRQLDAIKRKEDLDLLDVQYIKQTADEVSSFYKRSGDAKQNIRAEDMIDNMNSVRRFIENEVTTQYPELPISELNKNVRASRALLDAIVLRSGKKDTASLLNLGDMSVLGAGSVIEPWAGFAGLLTKKVLGADTVQLTIARMLDGLARKSATGKLTGADLADMDSLIQSELFRSLPTPEKTAFQEFIEVLRKTPRLEAGNLAPRTQQINTPINIPPTGQVPLGLGNEAQSAGSRSTINRKTGDVYNKDIKTGKTTFFPKK